MNMEDCPRHQDERNPPYPFVCDCTEEEVARYGAWKHAVAPIKHYIAGDGYSAMAVRETSEVVESAMRQADYESEPLREAAAFHQQRYLELTDLYEGAKRLLPGFQQEVQRLRLANKALVNDLEDRDDEIDRLHSVRNSDALFTLVDAMLHGDGGIVDEWVEKIDDLYRAALEGETGE